MDVALQGGIGGKRINGIQDGKRGHEVVALVGDQCLFVGGAGPDLRIFLLVQELVDRTFRMLHGPGAAVVFRETQQGGSGVFGIGIVLDETPGFAFRADFVAGRV